MEVCFDSCARQGWQCPICKRIYSPDVQMCFTCGSKEWTANTVSAPPKDVKVELYDSNTVSTQSKTYWNGGNL